MKKNRRLATMVDCALIAAMICILAPISLGAPPVRFTLGVFAILLCGALLDPIPAVVSVLVYVAVGLVGAPVFSGFQSGFAIFIGPTAGFIWAYPFMALAMSLSVKWTKKSKLTIRIAAMGAGALVALLVCYTFGMLWFSYLLDKTLAEAFAACVMLFIPFDLLKGVAAIAISIAVKRVFPG